MNNLKNILTNDKINVLVEALSLYKSHLNEQNEIFCESSDIVSLNNNTLSIVENMLVDLY